MLYDIDNEWDITVLMSWIDKQTIQGFRKFIPFWMIKRNYNNDCLVNELQVREYKKRHNQKYLSKGWIKKQPELYY